MDLTTITPLVITYDEAPNIARVLERLAWAPRVVVVDSGSTDGTLELIAGFPNVEVVHQPFNSFARQCNTGLGRIGTEWVLSMDADYLLSDGFVQELAELQAEPGVAGFRARFRYCIGGRPLRSALYPPRTVLHRRNDAYYVDDGHRHRVVVTGAIGEMGSVIYHDDRKPLARWLGNQRHYAAREAEKLLSTDSKELGLADRLRLLRIAPVLVPLYCLFARGLIRDGAAGWRYTLERTYAEVLLALELSERRITSSPPGTGS